MTSFEERRQGRRLLLAMGTILTVVPMAGILLMVPGALVLTYLFGGWDAVLAMPENWSGKGRYADNFLFRLGVGVVVLIGLGIPMYLWHRFFIASGYISKETDDQIDAGQWPVVGGYWKPLVFTVFIGGGAWVAYASFQQGVWFLFILMTWFVYIYTKLSIKEFLAWRRKMLTQESN